jgi:IS4 transposase
MACRTKHLIEKALCHLFPSTWLDEQARETGMVQRQRKVSPISLFWTLVLSFGIGKEHSIASLRRAYSEATGVVLSASSFYDRFTPRLVDFLQRGCDRALQQVTVRAPVLRESLSAFRDVLITDATVLRLHDLLKKTYTACRTNHTQAAAKLHLVYSVFGTSDQQIRLTSERRQESKVLTVGEWVNGRLLLFDLGYFSYGLLDRIRGMGGFFVSRLKDGCNPLITAVHQGDGKELVGRKLQEVLFFLRREVLDVEVDVTYQKRKYRGKQRSVTQSFRLVGLKHPVTKEYHLYLTNLPLALFSARAIALLYSARWLVELIFKQLKSYYQLDAFPSQNLPLVHALIYAALITLCVSQRIEQELGQLLVNKEQNERDENPEDAVFPFLRLASVLSALSAALLVAVLLQAGVKRKPLSLTALILKEAHDPNRKRDSLAQKLLNL